MRISISDISWKRLSYHFKIERTKDPHVCKGRWGKSSNMQDAWEQFLVPGIELIFRLPPFILLAFLWIYNLLQSLLSLTILVSSWIFLGRDRFLGHWMWFRVTCGLRKCCQGQLLDWLWGEILDLTTKTKRPASYWCWMELVREFLQYFEQTYLSIIVAVFATFEV